MKTHHSDLDEELQSFLAAHAALPPTTDPAEICRRVRRLASRIGATLRPEEIKKEREALIAKWVALEQEVKHLSDSFEKMAKGLHS